MILRVKRRLCMLRTVLIFPLVLIALAELRAAEKPLKPQRVSASLLEVLGFEGATDSAVWDSWRGSPEETVAIDHSIKHSGQRSARISRTATAAGTFSSLRSSVLLSFRGRTIELRGYLRTDAVSDSAGLWLREDGDTPGLQYADMRAAQLKGNSEWKEYSLTLPLHADATRLAFGVTLEGTGTVWADDLQVRVDGSPIWNAPPAERPQTVLDRDQAFVDGSNIALTELSPVQVERLARLAKLWGFLKYHHPALTNGTRHWDFELFRQIPPLLIVADDAAVNALFLAWTKGLGEVKSQPGTAVSGDVAVAADDDWIDDRQTWGLELSRMLRAIRAAHTNDDQPQFYVSLTRIGNPQFTHELPYPDITLPDAGYQLLGLFRFWNMVEYWAPYRPLIDGNWDAILREFIPRVALARSSEEYQLAMMALIGRVSDTHANLWSSLLVRPPTGPGTIPAVFRFIEGEPTVVKLLPISAQPPSELRLGDVVTTIDGRQVRELAREWTPFYAASNNPARLRNIASFMGRGPLGQVTLQVRRSDEIATVTCARVPMGKLPAALVVDHERAGPAFQRLSPAVAYLKLSSAEERDVPGFLERTLESKGWIIDLRGYPHGNFQQVLGGHFVDNRTPFARATKGDLAHPGTFVFERPLAITSELPRYKGKVVVLVDEATQSAAEFQAMAFRSAPNAIVVGSTTAGADGNITRCSIPGGFFAMFSGLGVYYPDKRPTQRVGIVPDIEAKPTQRGIRAGRDEVMETALRVILGPEASADEIQKLAAVPE